MCGITFRSLFSCYDICTSQFIDLDKPVIIKNILNETNLNLTCEADGHPSSQYQWFKNGKAISTKNYIIIKKVNSTEISDYRCQVNNDVETMPIQTSCSACCEFDFIVAVV